MDQDYESFDDYDDRAYGNHFGTDYDHELPASYDDYDDYGTYDEYEAPYLPDYPQPRRRHRAYLHCFPRLLVDDKEKHVFALAHALGLITEESDGQYWHQPGAKALGRSLSTALDKVLCQDELRVRKDITSRIAHPGPGFERGRIV